MHVGLFQNTGMRHGTEFPAFHDNAACGAVDPVMGSVGQCFR